MCVCFVCVCVCVLFVSVLCVCVAWLLLIESTSRHCKEKEETICHNLFNNSGSRRGSRAHQAEGPASSRVVDPAVEDSWGGQRQGAVRIAVRGESGERGEGGGSGGLGWCDLEQGVRACVGQDGRRGGACWGRAGSGLLRGVRVWWLWGVAIRRLEG